MARHRRRTPLPYDITPLTLRGEVDGPPVASVKVPVGIEGWLSANDRRHFLGQSSKVKAWRERAYWAARSVNVPRIERAYLLAELRFNTNRRRDPANWHPTVKAVLDGFVDADVFADDSADYVLGPDVRLGPVTLTTRGLLVMHMWRLA